MVNQSLEYNPGKESRTLRLNIRKLLVNHFLSETCFLQTVWFALIWKEKWKIFKRSLNIFSPRKYSIQNSSNKGQNISRLTKNPQTYWTWKTNFIRFWVIKKTQLESWFTKLNFHFFPWNPWTKWKSPLMIWLIYFDKYRNLYLTHGKNIA